MYQWILRQQQEGMRVTTIDIVSHLQVLFSALCYVDCFRLGFCFWVFLLHHDSFNGKATLLHSKFLRSYFIRCILLSNLSTSVVK